MFRIGSTRIRRTVPRLMSGLAALIAAQTLLAQGFPSRPVVWVVPFTPGGITDHTSRLIGRHVSVELGQQVVIENRPGAGGAVGTEQVARANPDGHTVLYGSQATMASNVSMYKALRYHPIRDFVPIHGMFSSPIVVVANAARPYRTIAELVDFGRANPGKLTMASAGQGTGTHLAGELMQSLAKIKMTHVPYKGSAPALTDLIGGQVDVMFDYAVSSGPHIRSGKLRGLAVTSANRLGMLPEVPTSAETGMPAFDVASWSGMFAPAKTPPEAVARLTRAMEIAMASADTAKYAEQHGSRILTGLSGATFSAFIESEITRWAEVIRRADIKLE